MGMKTGNKQTKSCHLYYSTKARLTPHGWKEKKRLDWHRCKMPRKSPKKGKKIEAERNLTRLPDQIPEER
jgi:hypothetical protein